MVVWAFEVPPGLQLGAAYFLLITFVCSHPTFECYIYIHVKSIIYNVNVLFLCIIYIHVVCVFWKAATGQSIPPEVLSEVFEHFGDDLQRDELTTELSMIKNAMNGATYSIDNMKENIRKYQELFPQTSRLLQLLLVMPTTSATSEQSFSSLRNIKTY